MIDANNYDDNHKTMIDANNYDDNHNDNYDDNNDNYDDMYNKGTMIMVSATMITATTSTSTSLLTCIKTFSVIPDVSPNCTFDDAYLCGYRSDWLWVSDALVTNSYPLYDHSQGRYPGKLLFS
jgi:hypothetical protein